MTAAAVVSAYLAVVLCIGIFGGRSGRNGAGGSDLWPAHDWILLLVTRGATEVTKLIETDS